MTSIKPKGPGSGVPTPDDVGGAASSRPAAAPRETFREKLDASRPAQGAAPVATPLASIADDLRAGKIDAATAVERLVARALSAPEAAALPPVRKAELEAHLRAALADDPTLLAMTKDLERAR